MKNSLYLYDEFLQKVDITPDQVQQWAELKILVPSGFTEDNTPCYSQESIERAAYIKQFLSLGYSPEEIQKIIRKVGLPSEDNKRDGKAGTDTYLTVGNLAEKAGISTRTIKHWEEKGIIEPEMRTQGGFRLYPDVYVYLCKLIVDLQNFGYSLEEIKTVSDYFRDFLHVRDNIQTIKPEEVEEKLSNMLVEIKLLFEKTDKLKKGIQRWEDLLKKKKKEIQNLTNQNKKRMEQQKN